MQDADKVFLEYVVKALVDNPNDVKIDRTVDEMGVLISLTVNPADMGKIIEPEGGQREYTAPQQDSTGSMGHANSEAPRSTPNSFKTVDQAMEDLKGI